MKLIYVASPLAGNADKNIQKALRYCSFVASCGEVPLAPHTIFTRFLDDTDKEQRRCGIKMGFALLAKCEELWVFGSIISTGMKSEITIAKAKNIPIRYFTEDCEEVL